MTEVRAPAPLEVDARIAGAREVDARDIRIGCGHVRVAGTKRSRLELVAGIQGAELEIAARFRLQNIDQIAGRIELEIAVRFGRRNLGRGAHHRAGSDGRVAGTGSRGDEAVIGRVFLDQSDVRVAGLLEVGIGRGEANVGVAGPLHVVGHEPDVGVAGQLAGGLHADDHRARAGHRIGRNREVVEEDVVVGAGFRNRLLAALGLVRGNVHRLGREVGLGHAKLKLGEVEVLDVLGADPWGRRGPRAAARRRFPCQDGEPVRRYRRPGTARSRRLGTRGSRGAAPWT